MTVTVTAKASTTSRGVDVQRGVYDAFAVAMRAHYPRDMFRLNLRY
jgi:hypothetical protein